MLPCDLNHSEKAEAQSRRGLYEDGPMMCDTGELDAPSAGLVIFRKIRKFFFVECKLKLISVR